MFQFLIKFIKKFREILVTCLRKKKRGTSKAKISKKIVIYFLYSVKISQDALCNYLLTINF